MAQAALRPSQNLGRLLRSRRQALGWTLREVSERIQARGEPLPISTLVQMEHGKLDPGARRLHLLLRLFQIPSEFVSDMFEIESLGIEVPEVSSFATAREKARRCWVSGDFNRGFAWHVGLRVSPSWQAAPEEERIDATLQLANYARTAGRLGLATRALDEALRGGIPDDRAWRALVLGSTIWRRLGSRHVALAMIQRASALLGPDDREGFSMVLHEEALLLLEQGDTDAAQTRLRHALRHYRDVEDSTGEARCLVFRARVYVAEEKYSQAIRSARQAEAIADENDLGRVRVSALLQVGLALVLSGRAREAIEVVLPALTLATELQEDGLLFHAHYRLWRAYESLGQRGKADIELKKARLYADFAEDADQEIREVRQAAQVGERLTASE